MGWLAGDPQLAESLGYYIRLILFLSSTDAIQNVPSPNSNAAPTPTPALALAASDKYSGGQVGVKGMLKGSAICTVQVSPDSDARCLRDILSKLY